MKLFGNSLIVKSQYKASDLSQCDVVKLKTVATFMTGGHFNQEKSMIFRQLASITCCVQSFMLAQKRRLEISEFWPKSTFLLEQQIKCILICKPCIYT